MMEDDDIGRILICDKIIGVADDLRIYGGDPALARSAGQGIANSRWHHITFTCD